mmetsp:Transcript_105594/g.305213  ORF Transcript_105594/g.305213 Transcript_105594/m.305213 type:complete len:208 (-) Transcript_105594:324-947(-)
MGTRTGAVTVTATATTMTTAMNTMAQPAPALTWARTSAARCFASRIGWRLSYFTTRCWCLTPGGWQSSVRRSRCSKRAPRPRPRPRPLRRTPTPQHRGARTCSTTCAPRADPTSLPSWSMLRVKRTSPTRRCGSGAIKGGLSSAAAAAAVAAVACTATSRPRWNTSERATRATMLSASRSSLSLPGAGVPCTAAPRARNLVVRNAFC